MIAARLHARRRVEKATSLLGSLSGNRPQGKSFVIALAAINVAGVASAETIRVCGTALVARDEQGRLFNHFPYEVAAREDLVRPSSGAGSRCTAVHKEMREALEELLREARTDEAAGSSLILLSCFRSPKHQERIFCGGRRTFAAMGRRAQQVAPPGFSEHATGLAVDFGDRSGRCRLTACFATTRAGQWLSANAARFGFELSFPEGNPQGVAFEPWHWRWVGDASTSLTGHHAVFANEQAAVEPASAGVRTPSGPPPAPGESNASPAGRLAPALAAWVDAADRATIERRELQ